MSQRSEKHAWLIKRAKRYARTNNAAAVERVMVDLLSEAPDDTVALALLGAARFQSGRPADAIVAYRRALRVDPGLGVVRYQLGLAQAALARHEEALMNYQSAMALLALGRASDAGPLIDTARERMPGEHPLSSELDRMAARYCQVGVTH
jgi:tetratricopeptide (TPR) repeat protein